jgi:hypothetical protein
MANPSLAGNSYRAARRSTRRDEAVLVTVSGVDSRRGPYTEQVSTLTISCHGCKYPSKYQVMPDAVVTLELVPETDGASKISARGRVKWIQRDAETGGPLFTAVEFENPYNIWRIDSPPEDWLPYAEPRKPVAPASPLKRLAVMKPELLEPIVEAASARAKIAGEPAQTQLMPSATKAVGPLMGEFQQQMERMISDAVAAAVREKTTSIMSDLHSSLRDEAKSILSDVSASQTGLWIERSLKQIQRASQESAKALHFQWTKKVETDLAQSLQRIETQQREVEQLAETLCANALGRMQRTLDAVHKDAVERIVMRLKDRMAPTFKDALGVAADLTKRKEDLEKSLADSSDRAAARFEETCERLEKQFEIVMRARLDAASEELERVTGGVANSASKNISAASERYEHDARARLKEASDRAVEQAKKSLEQKAAATSNEFANELTHYSRSHLEFVSGAIAELAKGIGKLAKD